MTEQLLQRYFTNQVSADEARYVLDWFATHAGKTYLTRRLTTQLNDVDWHVPSAGNVPDADQLFNRIRQQTEAPKQLPIFTQKRSWFDQPIRWVTMLVDATRVH
ncbi:hypothetical protein GCM10027341_27590 [Spirosoma knui]